MQMKTMCCKGDCNVSIDCCYSRKLAAGDDDVGMVGGLAAGERIVHYWGKAPGGGGGYAGCGTIPISSGVKLELSIITPTPIRAAFYRGAKALSRKRAKQKTASKP